MAPWGGRGASLSARTPGAIAESFGIDMPTSDADDGRWVKIGHNTRYGRVDHEGYEEKESEYGQEGRRPQA